MADEDSGQPDLRYRGRDGVFEKDRVRVVDLGAAPATHAGIPPAWVADGITLTGAVLGAVGLEPPLLMPDEAIVVKLVAVERS